MKVLSLLAPLLNLLKNFGFIYRIIGIGICATFFLSNAKDLLFLSSSKGVEPMTIEQLSALPKSEIPRYLRLENLTLMSDSYVATEDEDSGRIIDASYPVYSLDQLGGVETNGIPPAHVIIKDKNFDEESLNLLNSVDGMYDNEGFGEVKDILNANGLKISEDAILIVKEKPPAFQSTLLWTLLTGLGALLIGLSFIPSNVIRPESAPTQEQTGEDNMA